MKMLQTLLALGIACTLAAAADAQPKPFEPQVGQPGKDVIWVPTPDEMVDRMLRMAQVTPADLVYDLGAGDGKIVIAAAKKFGARAVGIEYNPDMVKYAQAQIERAGVGGRARIVQGDIFASDFSQATVVTLYLLPALNLKLRPQILAMRPGTRVVSYSFTMDDWEPDETSSSEGRRAYFWVVPANVHGAWSLESGSERFELAFEQRYQKIEGTVALGPQLQGGLREPRLRGVHISFAFVDNQGIRREYSGRVSGARMEGSFRTDAGGEGRWTAVRK
jgi:SAM-dependent methyltransferase